MDSHWSRRRFLTAFSAGGTSLLLPRVGRRLHAAPDDGTEASFDIAVVGGTPGGIAAAVAAARLGRKVALIESHRHLGGMSASGLGKSDIEHREMIQGMFAEFTGRIHRHYVETYGPDSENVALCRQGYYYEPSVAESVFDALVGEQSTLTVLRGHRFDSVVTQNGTVKGVVVYNRETGVRQRLNATIVIDATYEGDVYAAAGAKFLLGRESRETFGEPHAGVVYFDYQNQRFLDGTTGAASDGLPAYTYRLCLTTDPGDSHRLTDPPPDYDRSRYLGYFDDLRAGRLAGPKNFKPGRGYNPAHFDTLFRALSVTEIPNRKTDVNMNPRPLGFPFAEENAGYVEGDWDTRDRIAARIRNITLGLVWFLQNDTQVPAAHRGIANEYQFPLDEFIDNGHFPFQLYVREARRLVGQYTLTELDVTRTPEQPDAGRFDDAVAVGEFPIDSFPVRKRQPGDTLVLEGYLGMLDHITRPYQIPYRIMIPERVDGLIVPVAASTSHVAYSSIRMEPTWMALGQAAGVAAHLAIRNDVPPRDVSISALQRQLRTDGQVIDLPA
ncbi:MAG: FAD-dependent oxidoreductase [Planctomycetaceae bacterium]